MNDLYIHQLETENKQLRQQLQLIRKSTNELVNELNNKLDVKDKIINELTEEVAKLKGGKDE